MREKISSYQLFALFFTGILSTTGIAYPPSVAGKSGWISVLIASGLKFSVAIIATLIIKRNPAKTLIDALYNNPLIKVIVFLVFAFYLIVLNTMTITGFREITEIYMLPDTPVIVVLFTAIVIGVLAAKQGIEVISRMAEWILPIMLFVIAFLTIIQTSEVSTENLTPILEDGWKPVLKGAIETFDFLSYIVMALLLAPYINKSSSVGMALSAVVLAAMIALLLESVYILGIMGDNLIKMQYFPGVNYARYVEIAEIISRTEAPLLAMWIPSILLKISLSTFLFSDLVARFFKLKERKVLPIPFNLLCSAWSLAMFSSIQDFTDFSSNIFALFSMTIALFLPLFCLPFLLKTK